jgi:site-specific recombinase XerD
MKVNQNLCVLFWLRKSKADENGHSPVYVRLTIEGSRNEFSLGKKIHPDRWIAKIGLMKGNSEEAKTFNNYLATVRGDLQKHYNLLITQNNHVTSEMVRNAFCGIKEEQKSLLEAIDYHNLKFGEKVKQGILSEDTLQKYETMRDKVVEFIKYQYKVSNYPLNSLKLQFLTNFEHFLLVHQKLHINTTAKYIKNLKKVVRMATGMEWLLSNPFEVFKCKHVSTDREVLTQEDLGKLYHKEITIERLAKVRDIFLFCCYTGFAYKEVKTLPYDAIQKGIDGEQWLSINRSKSGTLESVMLLPLALEIINRYRDYKPCQIKNTLLPVNSNQNYNAYLKELADICGIKIELTTHIARHTFATTVTLANGVPIETVSALLGHKDIKTTQIYAKVAKIKVSSDMKALRNVLQSQETQVSDNKQIAV